MPVTVPDLFQLEGSVAFVTGGGGLLGPMHASALLELGATVALADIDRGRAESAAMELSKTHGNRVFAVSTDVTLPASIAEAAQITEERAGSIDILINNAAVDPKVGGGPSNDRLTRLEQFPLETWRRELDVGVTGTFLCCQIIGSRMASRGRGVILNISSDLGIIAPDQRLYQKPGAAPDEQPVKPITYSAVKHAVIGLTRYLATYWAEQGVRVNALAPGGVLAGQSQEFLERVHSRIPLGRLANQDEYKGAVAFLCSNASSYMNGAVVVADGGRSVW